MTHNDTEMLRYGHFGDITGCEYLDNNAKYGQMAVIINKEEIVHARPNYTDSNDSHYKDYNLITSFVCHVYGLVNQD